MSAEGGARPGHLRFRLGATWPERLVVGALVVVVLGNAVGAWQRASGVMAWFVLGWIGVLALTILACHRLQVPATRVDADGVHRETLLGRRTVVRWDDVHDLVIERARRGTTRLNAVGEGGERTTLPVEVPDQRSQVIAYWRSRG